MYLIMNADDFGMTKSVNDGIIYAYQNGIIRSTTAMCNMPYLKEAAVLKKQNPGLGVGLHLTISAGDPLLKTHKTLVDQNGSFYHKSSIIREKTDMDPKEVSAEFEAQIQMFIDTFGCLPDHIDGHHGCIMFDHIWPCTKKLADQYGLRIRRKTDPILYYDYFYQDKVNAGHFKEVIKRYLDKDAYGLEIGCHPGFVDYELYKGSSYNIQRLHEIEVLTDKNIMSFLEENKIILSSYSDI